MDTREETPPSPAAAAAAPEDVFDDPGYVSGGESSDGDDSWDDLGVFPRRGHHLSQLVPLEVWRGHETRLVRQEDLWVQTNGNAMNDIADELLYYQAGTRLTQRYVDGLDQACQGCEVCAACVDKKEIMEGRRRVKVSDIARYSKQISWVWFSLDLRASVTIFDAKRADFVADRFWDKEVLKLLSTRLSPYLLPVTRWEEAEHRLLDRVLNVGKKRADERKREYSRLLAR